MKYRRLEAILDNGEPEEKAFAADLLRHMAKQLGHSVVRGPAWRAAEQVWFDALKLQEDRGSHYPEHEAMYWIDTWRTAESKFDVRRHFGRR
ncbi:hypothetical protein [Mycobacterium intracellulare]|uniref:hypothetical protein n=1 Tax=Mycobacterium intracellulare TaxID=1767 RepID=UPI00080BA4C5|nr:hypothetical protein [Mycobacterium intracellulare]OCB25382.1 hypothetical protein A5644_10680 [Mycobacterium intracellulare subsp. yongonense]